MIELGLSVAGLYVSLAGVAARRDFFGMQLGRQFLCVFYFL
jgi:hypothetical protein